MRWKADSDSPQLSPTPGCSKESFPDKPKVKHRKCSQRQWCIPGRRSTPVAAQPGKSYGVPGKRSPLLPEPVEGIGSSDLNTDDENSDVDVTGIEEITEQISSPLDHPFSEGNGSFAQSSTTLSCKHHQQK